MEGYTTDGRIRRCAGRPPVVRPDRHSHSSAPFATPRSSVRVANFRRPGSLRVVEGGRARVGAEPAHRRESVQAHAVERADEAESKNRI
jgi:hypothetical protein